MKKVKIMVVEDEAVVIADIKMSLTGLGYDVCAVATSGEDAIKKAEEIIPDLILMDIKLAGGMDGIATAKVIHSRFDIPVIYLTAYVNEDYLKRAKKTEPFGYLTKPIVHKELQANIEMALFKHAIDRQLSDKNAHLNRIMNSTVDSMAEMIRIKDPFIGDHHIHVSQLSKAIAEEMGLSRDQIEGISVAARIHDVGMIGIPFEILSKPTLLNESERGLYESHSKRGYDLLKNIDFFWPVADMVLQSHEKMNGSGFPSGLKGEDILLEARIICVASAIDNYVYGRPNSPPLTVDMALEEISKDKGVRYDSTVVDACLMVIKEKRFEFEK